MKSNINKRVYAAKIGIFWVIAKDFGKIIWIIGKNTISLHPENGKNASETTVFPETHII